MNWILAISLSHCNLIYREHLVQLVVIL
nr:unnamed protein product [Callosobruchus chinensis]